MKTVPERSAREVRLCLEKGELAHRVWDRLLFGGESEESADCRSGTLKLTRHSCREQEGGREGRRRGPHTERAELGQLQVLTWSRVCGCSGQ